MDSHLFETTLRTYWGYSHFRGIQQDIIESIAQGKDTLGLMPTGGGKSITFQVPALCMEGVCLVVTPLIALMKDQVSHLRAKGIQGAAIYSGMSRQEIIKILDNAIFGGIKILYISPERLASDIFRHKLRRINVSFITVDEAHCISQWGYDFRPSYLQIARIRQEKKTAPLLALTATATPEVVEDIQNKLLFREKNVFKMSFERKNLAYVVRHTPDKFGELLHILRSVKGSAIVYVRSRRHAKETATLINDNGISATFYHAGLDAAVKDARQDAWQNNEYRVMVATNAFGMGIDKPDVRLVIHQDCPDSIEAYFQEAGRAGRDGLKAYAVLLYNNTDKRKLHKRIAETFPEKTYIKTVYEHLASFFQIGAGSGSGHTFQFDIDKFCTSFKHYPQRVDAALRILARCGYIDYEVDSDSSARVMFLLKRSELYLLDETSYNEEAVITALLRNYGNLFVDYSYINENLLARVSGLTPQQVYLNLKALGKRRIIHFVPQRKLPYIGYRCNRLETERLVIPPDVYEVRKEQFTHRIDAMIEYATNNQICRSRQLLRYFGETRSTDCGCCDVCLDKADNLRIKAPTHTERKAILDLLADGKAHFISELLTLDMPTNLLDDTLSYLVNEHYVKLSPPYISLYNI